ncbi:MAG: chorismate mutase [Ignavibacteriales bacterium]|nr:chorismate mutase [Ignavibacteriales bacterium]
MNNHLTEDLERWRDKIDVIDSELVRLLNERARCAEEIGRIKLILGLDAYSPEREEEVMKNVTTSNPGPLSLQALRRLFERIIDESRSIERLAMMRKKNRQDRP